jgi:hypothetical protein
MVLLVDFPFSSPESVHVAQTDEGDQETSRGTDDDLHKPHAQSAPECRAHQGA